MPSTTSGIFELNAGTVLAAGDVLPFVDISDPSQAPQGSLLKITMANFFHQIPSTSSTFGATALPAGVVSLQGAGFILGVTPDTNTNAARRPMVVQIGYGGAPVFVGYRTGGTVTIPTATPSAASLTALNGNGWDGTAYGGGSSVILSATETWSVGGHGASVQFWTNPTGSTSSELALTIKTTATTNTRLVPGSTSLVFANNADNADNLKILDAGGATFRSTVTGTSFLPAALGVAVDTSGATVLHVNNNATANLATTKTCGMLVIFENDIAGIAGVFLLQDSTGTALVSSGTGAGLQWRVTKDAGSGFNVYYETGNLVVQNKGGATAGFWYQIFKTNG